MKMRENLSKFIVGGWKIICVREALSYVMAAKGKKENFSIYARKLQQWSRSKKPSAKEYKRLFKEKLKTNEGKFPVQKIFISWTYHLPFLSHFNHYCT